MVSIEAVSYGSTNYTPEKITDFIYLVHPNDVSDGTEYCSNNSFLNTQRLTFVLQLPDNITIDNLYNGKGDVFDLSKSGAITYEDNKATVSLSIAYDRAKFGGHSYSGCYYFKLSDGSLYTLVCDSPGCQFQWNTSTGGKTPFAPQSVQLYNVEQDYFYEDYAVTDLQVFGRGHGSVVNMSLSSETPIILKAQAVYNSYEISDTSTMNNSRYDASVACSAWTIVNGNEMAAYSTANDYMSPAFSLKSGINIVEVVVDTGGFCTRGGDSSEWFSSTNMNKTTRRTCSVVYIIDYNGPTAETNKLLGTSAELDLKKLRAFSFALDNGPVTERIFEFEEKSINFALPTSSKESPALESVYYEKGVLLYLPTVETGAKVTILDDTEEQSFVSGNEKGFLHAINPCELDESGNFGVMVTSEDGNNERIYTFHITFASGDTALSLVTCHGVELDEEFNTEQNAYYITYSEDQATLEFTMPEGATLTLDGKETSPNPVSLSKNSDFHTLTITAADGITTASYFFITQEADGSVPYYSYADGTEEQVSKLLSGYRNWISNEESISGAWQVFMAKAAADDLIDWDGKYIEELENNTENRQATDPARNILEAVLLGENPYRFDPNGDGEYRNFVEELQMWSNGGAWANNIWYDWAAKAVGIPTYFEDSLKYNAMDRGYDLDMRAWTIAALLSLDEMDQKNMVPYVESLKNVQIREDNPISDLKYTGLWRMVAHYSSYDTNAYTIGTVLSAFGAAGVDPDRAFAVTASDGTVYEPLDQIEKWLWDEETGTFCGEAEEGVRAYVKDIIIGLGDILQGSNVWNRCALTEEKFNALVAKASDTAKAAALTGAELAEAPVYGGADYGKYYYFLYEAVADELEADGDTSMRPKVIWDTPVGQFQKAVAALPASTEESYVSAVAEVIALYEKLYAAGGSSFTDAVGTDTIVAYRTAVAAALTKQDSTGDTADFYTRVLALPDALLISENSREEVDALRTIYDGMTTAQRDLVDWAGASVLLHLQAAEAALGQGSGSDTMTVHFALLGAPDDGENGTVNTLKDGNLETWLEDDYVFNADSISAEQAFRVILGDVGISWKGGSSNSYGTLYVSAVKNPATGEWMEEFTTTANSGWMYTVNGLHPNMGLSAYMLKDGDTFVFHYTDDFTLETDPWDGTIVNDESKTGAATTITDAATGTFVVECDRACAVLAKAEDGSYVLLPAAVTPGENGFVSFTAGDYNEVLIRVKGDLTGDGIVDSSDTLMMKKLAAGLETPDAITALLMDLTGEGETNSSDTLKMKRVAAGLDTLPW